MTQAPLQMIHSQLSTLKTTFILSKLGSLTRSYTNAAVIFLLAVFSYPVTAQMVVGNDTLYGNEWIVPDQPYYSFTVSQDGLITIKAADLISQGILLGTTTGSQWQIWRNGKQIPLYVPNSGVWSATDQFWFYGEKNRSELDAHLFIHPNSEMLNPEYSLYSDSAIYFLTISKPGSPSLRITLENTDHTLPLIDHIPVTQKIIFHDFPIDKKYDFDNEIAYSTYDETEGFGSKPATSFSRKMETTGVMPGLSGRLRIRLAGLNYNHLVRISIDGIVVKQDTFYGYQLKEYILDLTADQLSNDVNLSIQGTAAANDLFSVSILQLDYFKRTNVALLSGEQIRGPATSVRYPSPIQSPVFLLQSGLVWKRAVEVSGSYFLQSKIENEIQWIADPANAIPIRSLNRLTFADITSASQTNYLIIYHPSLAATAREYVQYRNSAIGGRYTTTMVDVEQVFLQFGYGERQALGLRNYGQYIRRRYPDLNYILLLGRGLNYRDRRIDQNAITYKNLDLIPTYGYPGGDNLLFAEKGASLPNILFGRIAAATPEQAQIYLQKVKEYEQKLKSPSSNDDLYWRKSILHLAGGNNEGFDSILDEFKESIEDSKWNPQVTSVEKTSSDPVQGGPSNIVINKINEGVAIHTYLGHGAVSATEIGLDDPDLFNNVGKYPISFTLGCNSGNIHTTGYSLSESFLFSRKGNIAYISSTSIGTDGGYRSYGLKLYPLIGGALYDASIAKQHYQSLEAFFQTNKDVYSTSLCQQLAIHGDPAIQLHYFDAPDFTLDGTSFQTIPQNVQADQDSLRFQVRFWNLGKDENQLLTFIIQHTLPDGRVLEYRMQTKMDLASQLTRLAIPMPANALGKNKINILLDPDNQWDERPQPFAENNNQLMIDNRAGIEVEIFDDAIIVANPPNLGITGQNPLELTAFTSNGFSLPMNYFFEIDTTPLFNSPLLEKAQSRQRGGLISYRPRLTPKNETVYYWRIAADTLSTKKSFTWTDASFVYIDGKGPGWNQSHAFQFNTSSSGQDIYYDIDSRRWRLKTESVSIVASSINHALDPAEYSKILVNGTRLSRNNRTTDAEFMVTVWDTIVGDLIRNPIEGRDGAINVFGRIVQVFTFPMDKNTIQERANLIRFLETGILPGQYVIINNHIEPGKSYFPRNWGDDSITLGKNLFSVMEARGARQIRELQKYPSYPYLFIYQEKGRVIDEKISDDGLQVRSAFELNRVRTKGATEVVLQKSVHSWDRLEWSVRDQRNKRDSLTVLGWTGTKYDSLFITSDSIVSLATVDPGKYKELRLVWSVSDPSKTQDYNLVKWRIYYSGLADLAIQSNEDFIFRSDTIDQNDPVQLRYGIKNIGFQTIDSALVVHSYTDQLLQMKLDSNWIGRLVPGASQQIEKFISTEGKEKNQTINIIAQTLSGQPEITLKNNRGRLDYTVVKDLIPPNMEVFFDGKQIMNHDIVGKKPYIQIQLKDNKEFSLQDSSTVSMSIKFPGRNQFDPVSRANYQVVKNKNEITVTYQPQFTQSGTYSLQIQGMDRSGNSAGKVPYEIQFRIITENSISAVLPYPNPFTSQCRFAYTLTGEIPAVFKIQILTVAGRVVRELTSLDLGPLQEGTHLTERSWDGTDTYGNKLATGTYLYRVVTKTNDGKSFAEYETLEGNDSQADARRFFTKGLGKLVILR
jgi:flagellar hook assembly protein FlgD